MMKSALRNIALEVRKDIVRMHGKGTNVASAMSCADILTALYFQVMRIRSPRDPGRDRFILSKGHAAAALYSVLSHKGFISRSSLKGFLADGGRLTGHPSRSSAPGIEVSTGSLGHGLAVGAGMALMGRKNRRAWRVFVLMGDGELQEGSVWEAAALAASLRLDNVVAVVDVNGWQGYGQLEEFMPAKSLAEKWRAFGWDAREIDGHDMDGLCRTLDRAPFTKGRPSVILARTVKGRGVAEMEADPLGWHYFSVPSGKTAGFLAELERRK